MKQSLILKIIRQARSKIVPVIKPRKGYWLAPVRSLEPISKNHGFDRGTPIDRYYTEQFLNEHADDIKGSCLEITDNNYTLKFGGNKVAWSQVLDINRNNQKADIYGDLRSINEINDNTYDCFILTHTLGLIDDYESAIKESKRILKPGGVLLAVVGASGSFNPRTDFWKFTPNSARLTFSKYFKDDKLKIKTYGNVLSGQYQWVGLAAEELTEEEINYHHPRYTIVIGIRAVK